MDNPRDVLITGIGLISCLGEGIDATWKALSDGTGRHPPVDSARFPPFPVHAMVPLELDRQIPKRGDQRQMEHWQRIGVYAAGLALDDAGLKGNAELLDRTDMIVAAGGGERDYAVDAAILTALPGAADPGRLLNERLMSDLRPTLFLAQLSNLLAGNISVVHGVVGASRTFMGEEAAGVDAVRVGCARIADGSSDLVLVGGSYNGERPDTLLIYECGRLLWRGAHAGIWERQRHGGGVAIGSVGCFLVLESRAHARARGARAIARIRRVFSDRSDRTAGAATRVAEGQLSRLGPAWSKDGCVVISGASGAPAATAEEAAFLARLGLPVRALSGAIGHAVEPSFFAGIAVGASALARGALFAPLDPSEAEYSAAPRQALVTAWGHWRGEGLALLDAA